MNTYKAILDTRRPNGVIATITQFDNATLALQIVTNGEIEHPWEAPQFELIAMKRDQQAVRESDQAAFTINDAGEHRVTVDLKEQFLTCRGSVKMQFIVKDGDRLSTSIFYVMVGESLDHDIIESHRDVAVLDELETYVRQGFDDLAYQEQRMKDVEKATHELNELMVGNEAERQAAEANRQALFEGNESQRQNTFNQQLTSQRREFDTSQADREGVFNALKQNLSSEFNAAQNEREREFDRVMVSNQTQFNDAETSRASTFSHRQIENERTFTANENARQTLFNANEAERQTNEAGRVSNENTRKTNEAERVAAEAGRQQKMSEFEAKATQLSDELDAQVARVDAFVSANEEKLLGDRDKVDYMGNTHESVKAASDANVDWLLGEVNTAHYEGQHITATETIEGRSKSAILKGQTLVNIVNGIDFGTGATETDNSYILTQTGTTEELRVVLESNLIELNKDYTFIYYINEKTTTKDHTLVIKNLSYLVPGSNIAIPQNIGWNKIKFNVSSFGSNPRLNIAISSSEEDGVYVKFSKGSFALLSGDWTNKELPFDTIGYGMQSVKMPVLTTTGKNLFDIENTSFLIKTNINGETMYKIPNGKTQEFIVNPNKSPNIKASLKCYNDSGNDTSFGRCVYTDGTEGYIHPNTLTSDASKSIYAIHFYDWVSGRSIYVKNVMVSEDVATYEPYKSNILTVNEDVTLHGIGGVCDTLDCLTGEVTERIGEIVLDGSEDWKLDTIYTEHPRYVLRLKNSCSSLNRHPIISDYFPYAPSGHVFPSAFIFDSKLYVYLKETTTIDELRAFLQSNPVTIQYQLATESIKTVALSDHHVYSYKDVTHYDCSSAEGSLVPTLSIDVPTNLPAVVTRQRATIKELEKENVALKNEIEETANSSVNGDLELMSSQFELDFRLFEIEMNLDMPMMATMRGVKSMAMTVYQQAKTLILAGKYEREDMEYKLNRYKAAGRITVEEYEELIALMDARELVD